MGDGSNNIVYQLFVESFQRSGASLMSGICHGSSNFFLSLDQWTRWIENKTGMRRSGFFEDVSQGHAYWARYFGSRGYDPSASGVTAFSHYLTGGLGQASFDISMIMVMRLPAYSAVHGGAETYQHNGGVARGTTRGLVQGLFLHGVMKSLGSLPASQRIPSNGLVFGGTSLQQELNKPADQRDYMRVVSDYFLGMGLSVPGGRGGSRQSNAQMPNPKALAYKPKRQDATQLERAANALADAVHHAEKARLPNFATRISHLGKRLSQKALTLTQVPLSNCVERFGLRILKGPHPPENKLKVIDDYNLLGSKARTLDVNKTFKGAAIKGLGRGSSAEAWLIGNGPQQFVVKQRIGGITNYAEKTIALAEKVRDAGFPVVEMARLQGHPDTLIAKMGAGKSYYELPKATQKVAKANAEAVAKAAKKKTGGLSIDAAEDNFLYTRDGTITCWFDPGPAAY